VHYRQFGKLGYKVSALGFGCMRLPKTDTGAIDEPLATRMLHSAIKHGVDYFDTGYGYHNGESERFLGKALKESGYRQRVKVATKLPCWAVKEASDFERLFTEQLGKLQTDYVDLYLIHGLAKARWDLVRGLGVLSWLDKIVADGRARAVGFSFHDSFDVFKEIIDAYDHWGMCQILYNFMSETLQAGTKGLKYAAGKGLAVVVMEPLLGGRLANAPEAAQKLWDTAERKRTPAEWALQWLWSKPEVSVALSGMSTMQQVEENVASAGRSKVRGLSASEVALVARVRDAYEALKAVPCSSCAYCMPCPNGVDIPRTFSILNAGLMYGGLDEARRRYTHLNREQDAKILASSCLQCKECEENCPQHIPISDWMPYAHAVLGEGKAYDPEAAPKM
jgi:predicted aldo/keto reductase-like oxidoreductase